MPQVTYGGRAGNVYIVGLDGLLKSLNRAPAEMNKEIRVAAREIAKPLADDIKKAAANVSPGSPAQASLAAISVQARSDRVVTIKGGGSRVLRRTKKVVRGGKTRTVRRSVPLVASKVFFGSEFGSSLKQFPPHAGTEGYYFWPTIREKMPEIVEKYMDALDRVISKWAAGG